MTEPQKAPRGRVKRQPIRARGRLNVNGKDENYVYRFVNDVGDRIQMFQEAGYELVSKQDHKIVDNRLDIAIPDGTNAMVSVGVKNNGDAQRAYLMRIRREWYEEDQAEKQKDIKAVQEQIKNPNIDGAYGKISTEDVRAGRLPE